MPIEQIKEDVKENSLPDHPNNTQEPIEYKGKLVPSLFEYKENDWKPGSSPSVDKSKMVQEIFSVIKDEELPMYYKIGKSMISVA